jgi:hypothetical protein
MMNDADDRGPDPVAPLAEPAAAAGRIGIRIWALALTAGLLAGAIAWAAAEPLIEPEVGFQSKDKKLNVDPTVAGKKNGLISFGIFGAVLGLGMGLAGGLSSGSAGRAAFAGFVGLVVGGAATVAITWAVLPIYYQHTLSGDMTYSLMVHGGAWGVAGAVAGLAVGLGLCGWRGLGRGLIGGAVGALLATVIFEFAGGILLPRALTDRPVSPYWEGRVAARLAVAVLVAVVVLLCTEPPTTKPIAHDPSA